MLRVSLVGEESKSSLREKEVYSHAITRYLFELSNHPMKIHVPIDDTD